MYLHQKMIRIYADIVQNHTLPGVFPNFWRAVYIVYILLNNKSFIESLEAQRILLILCQSLETFSPAGAFRNRTNKLFKLITSDWFDFLQKLMSWWYTCLCAILCSCIFLLGTCNYCCFIIVMVLAAKQAWQKMGWSYEIRKTIK